MPDSVSERMRADWNERAREDAHYYVAFGGRDQDEAEFLATAADVLRSSRLSSSGCRQQPTGALGGRSKLAAAPDA